MSSSERRSEGVVVTKPPKKVLYVEDDVTNTELLREVLADEFEGEAHLLTACTAELGCDLAIAHVPDLIVMDWHLPGMSGGDAVELLAQSPRTRSIPIVSLSAGVPPARSGGTGREHRLRKPIDVAELVRVIRGIFDAAEAPRHT